MKVFNSRIARSFLLLMAAMFIALGITGIGAAPASADQTVPFGAVLTGAVGFASDGFPHFSGSGIATYLGNTTNVGHVVFTSGTPDCAGGVPNDNYETLTGANGDTLMIVSHDVACPTSPNVYQGGGQWEVLGGTGRFSGVTGGGTLVGTSDFNTGLFNFTLTGQITPPNGQ